MTVKEGRVVLYVKSFLSDHVLLFSLALVPLKASGERGRGPGEQSRWWQEG